METTQQIVAKNVRAWRLARGWTQADLAEKAIMSEISVTRIETGARGSGPSSRKKLAKAFGCTVKFLETDHDEKSASKAIEPDALEEIKGVIRDEIKNPSLTDDEARLIKAYRDLAAPRQMWVMLQATGLESDRQALLNLGYELAPWIEEILRLSAHAKPDQAKQDARPSDKKASRK